MIYSYNCDFVKYAKKKVMKSQLCDFVSYYSKLGSIQHNTDYSRIEIKTVKKNVRRSKSTVIMFSKLKTTIITLNLI